MLCRREDGSKYIVYKSSWVWVRGPGEKKIDMREDGVHGIDA
jgi:hypothetical protein